MCTADNNKLHFTNTSVLPKDSNYSDENKSSKSYDKKLVDKLSIKKFIFL